MSQSNRFNNKYTAIDLFCGAGGLSLGLKQAGFSVLAGIEVNSVAAETYRLNHPKVRLYENDIRSIAPRDLLSDLNLEVGDLDVLAGCPPCQGFSTQRTRNKVASCVDPRNDLVFEFLRFVKALLPKTIMLENVPGLAKDKRSATLQEELGALGYIINDDFARIVDASKYGVPQRRRRLIIKASRFGTVSNPPESRKTKTVADAIRNLPAPGQSGDPLHDEPEKRLPHVKKIISMIPKDGGSRSDLPEEYWLACHKRNRGCFNDVYGRMSWGLVSPTITGGCHNPSKGRFIHPEDDRAITLREAALLQSFPSDYQFSLRRGKESAALMIGNALPPELIRRHAIQFFEHLKGEAHEPQAKI